MATTATALQRTDVNNSVVSYDTDSGQVKLSPNIIKKYLVSGDPARVTDQEVMMFLMLCKHQRLNPFLREAYLIKFGNEKATIVTGKEVFTKRAAQSEKCTGWEAGIIVQNGQLEHREGTFKLPQEELVGGWAKVYKENYAVPITATVSMEEYERKKADGKPMANWKNMPATMIRKVALVHALREAFPEDFQGLYSAEEMPVEMTHLKESPVKQPDVEAPAPSPLKAAEEPNKPETAPPTAEDAQDIMDGEIVEGEVVPEDIPEPAPEPEKPKKQYDASADDRFITLPQKKRMFAISKSDPNVVLAAVRLIGYQVDETDDPKKHPPYEKIIHRKNYEAICTQIEKLANAKQNQPAEEQREPHPSDEDVPF